MGYLPREEEGTEGRGVQIAGAPAAGPLCRQWSQYPRRFLPSLCTLKRKETDIMGKQQEALERTIAAGANLISEKHAALLALCRELAGQMDEASSVSGPSTRLSAAYLSALKDLGRVLNVKEGGWTSGKLSELRSVQNRGDQRVSRSNVAKRRSGS